MNFTKAEMLEKLKQEVEGINILPIFKVYSDEYNREKESVVERIIDFSRGASLIVRSSSTLEDTTEFSNAGQFDSILNVSPNSKDIKNAIEKVYRSYHTDLNQQILIQPMLRNIKKSGVIFTSDMDTMADYYVANYYEGEDSAAVTSGTTADLKTFIHYKKCNIVPSDKDMHALIGACNLIEKHLKNTALDIEFAITYDGKVYILQVRPIARGAKENYHYIDIQPSLHRIYKKVSKLSKRHPFLLGHTTCFGVMPDWNPAEILGVRPKKLAISLYKELITDNIWAHQRSDYGYRDLTMHPLMISFCGIPYIDTRITFNSFVPAKLNEKIAEKLVDHYIDKLSKYPKYHDKIEFEIVYSCYYLGVHDDLKELLNYGFNENEITRIEFALLELTNNVINPRLGLYKKDIQKIEILEKNYEKIMHSEISIVDKIYWLIEECKEYGTLPFAGVARAGFIAVQFLKSFIRMGIITQQEYDQYMNTLDTVNKKMNRDLYKYHRGEISKEDFLNRYGHIRPGTYDILSMRYDEGFDEYFSGDTHMQEFKEEQDFLFSQTQMSKIQTELEQNGINTRAEDLLLFLKESIEGREQLKFIFTRSVSEILRLIGELGKRADIEKEDMAFLDISVIKDLYVDLYTGDIHTMFEGNIQANKTQYESAIRIKLPSIIVKPEDVYSFYLLGEEPNFVTQRSVIAETTSMGSDDYENKIVFIQAADPGYDFLFSRNIAGLITQFGGVNSHMAIRCAELGIPAIIGAGEKNYNSWCKYARMKIDCLNRKVLKI